MSLSGGSFQPEEVLLKHRIDELYTQWPFYGSRRITAQLHLEGVDVNRKAVQWHMREMGIEGIKSGQNLVGATTGKGCIPTYCAISAAPVSRPYVGYRHHVYSLTRELDVPGGGPGLVFTLRGQLVAT